MNDALPSGSVKSLNPRNQVQTPLSEVERIFVNRLPLTFAANDVRFGSKWTFSEICLMSALLPKADITERDRHVREGWTRQRATHLLPSRILG